MTTDTEAQVAPAVAPPGKGNGSNDTAAQVVPPSMICPHTESPCTKIPTCTLFAYTGKSYCVEWVEAQRAAGRDQLLGEGRP